MADVKTRYKQPETIAEAHKMLREGGAALEELTGEPAPEDTLSETGLRRGFRKLMGAERAPKTYGQP